MSNFVNLNGPHHIYYSVPKTLESLNNRVNIPPLKVTTNFKTGSGYPSMNQSKN